MPDDKTLTPDSYMQSLTPDSYMQSLQTPKSIQVPPPAVVEDKSRAISAVPPNQYRPVNMQNPGRDSLTLPFLASQLPLAGSFLGPEGTGLGIATKIGLRNEFPNLFGQNPQTPGGMAADVGLDALTQEGIPRTATALMNSGIMRAGAAKILSSWPLKNFPAVREGISKTLAATGLGKYQYPESGILESAAENAANTKDALTQHIVDTFNKYPDMIEADPKFYPPELKMVIQADKDTFGKNSIGGALLQLKKEAAAGSDVAGSQTYSSISNQLLSDIRHVRNWKIATGESKTAEQVALNDLITDGFKESTGKINAAGILNKLSGDKKEVYEEAISPGQLANLKDFATTLQQQEKSGSGVVSTVLRMAQHRLMWSVVPVMEGFGLHRTGALAGGMVGGISLLNHQIGKLMADPQTAQLVTQALKTPITSPEASLLSQALANAIRTTGGAAEFQATQAK